MGTAALGLWNVLGDAYHRLGFDAIADYAFRAMVLARVIEPTSKVDTVRVLAEIGAPRTGGEDPVPCAGPPPAARLPREAVGCLPGVPSATAHSG